MNSLGPDVKKTTEIYVPPRMVLGKYPVQRKLELDDVPFGTYFKRIIFVMVGTARAVASVCCRLSGSSATL